MQITDVRVRKATNSNPTDKFRASCSVVFDGMFVVHDLRIVEGINGPFVAMPRRKNGEGEYKDIAHPITAEARDLIQRRVLEAYNQMEAKANQPMEAEENQESALV